jgi:hypothetical protein
MTNAIRILCNGLLLCAAASLLVACSDSRKDVLKSPCAGIEGSPCGDKRPANQDVLGYSFKDLA